MSSANELHQHATRYCSQLQEYNAKLQDEVQALSEQLKALQVLTQNLTIGNRHFVSMLRTDALEATTQVCGHDKIVITRFIRSVLVLMAQEEKNRSTEDAATRRGTMAALHAQLAAAQAACTVAEAARDRAGADAASALAELEKVHI